MFVLFPVKMCVQCFCFSSFRYDTTVKSNYLFHLCDIQIKSIVANIYVVNVCSSVYCIVQMEFG